MLEVKGFCGLRFVADSMKALDYVITPPYDVITPEQRELLVSRSPHSMAQVILPQDREDIGRYDAAAQDLEAWIDDAILVQDDRESVYLLEQSFRGQDGEPQARRGFLAVAKLPEPGERIILGHEHTFDNVVDDRYRLTASTRANLGPVFAIYDDGGRTPNFLADWPDRTPDLTAYSIDGVRQRVWRTDPTPELAAYFRDKRLYIADGHHRFHTACMYRDAMRAAQAEQGFEPETHPRLCEYDYVLMGFVALSDPGLEIWPTHRLMRRPQGFNLQQFLTAAEPWFDVIPVESDLPGALAAETGCAVGLVLDRRTLYVLRLSEHIERRELLGGERTDAWRDLDVAVLHKGIVEHIMGLGDDTVFAYERNPRKAVEAVAHGEYDMGFLLRPTSAEQIKACAEAGENMPHKSTYFHPKLPTGAVIHRLI